MHVTEALGGKEREENRKYIWRNDGQNFSKVGENNKEIQEAERTQIIIIILKTAPWCVII